MSSLYHKRFGNFRQDKLYVSLMVCLQELLEKSRVIMDSKESLSSSTDY